MVELWEHWLLFLILIQCAVCKSAVLVVISYITYYIHIRVVAVYRFTVTAFFGEKTGNKMHRIKRPVPAKKHKFFPCRDKKTQNFPLSGQKTQNFFCSFKFFCSFTVKTNWLWILNVHVLNCVNPVEPCCWTINFVKLFYLPFYRFPFYRFFLPFYRYRFL
jgi:hypothetical protein